MDRSGTAAGESETPEQMLHAVVGQLSHAMESSAYAGSKYEPLGRALVFRLTARSLHVVGDSPLAAEFRRLVTAGAVPGWDLHPEPAGRTPLHVLAGPLHRLSGSNRFYNLLEREGFGYVEEVAVTPEVCLLEFRNSGPRFITAVRQVIADLRIRRRTGQNGPACQAPGDAGRAAAGPVPPARLARGRGQGTAGRGRVGGRRARGTGTLGISSRSLPAWRTCRLTSPAAGTASASSASSRWPGRRCPTATCPGWPGTDR